MIGNLLNSIRGYIDSFLAWGTEETVIPYAISLLIVGIGFGLMWWKSHWATIPHELGHAFMALLLGKKLAGININRDTSGETQTTEYKSMNPLKNLITAPFRWIRNLLVSFAGYPAPFLLAYGLLFFWARDQSKIAVLILTILLVFTFLYSTNLFGFLLIVGGLIITGLALWMNSAFIAEAFILLIAGGMIAGGIKGVIEAWKVYQSDMKFKEENVNDPNFEPQHSDARALSKRTLLPQIVWLIAFSLVGAVLTFLSVTKLLESFS